MQEFTLIVYARLIPCVETVEAGGCCMISNQQALASEYPDCYPMLSISLSHFKITSSGYAW